MIMRLILASMLFVAPLHATEKKYVVRAATDQYFMLVLWARYCPTSQDIAGGCYWIVIADNSPLDVTPPPGIEAHKGFRGKWTSEVDCMVHAQFYIKQFVDRNPGYEIKNFHNWHCYGNGKRPPQDV